MSQLELLRDVWDACTVKDREEFLQLLVKGGAEEAEGEEAQEEAEEAEDAEEAEATPELCGLCLEDMTSETVNPYVCVHEFCKECFDTSKHMACMKSCPVCRGSLRPPVPSDESMFTRALDIYFAIVQQYGETRSKVMCRTDTLFYNVDILDHFRLISSDPVNFMNPMEREYDGGIKWDSGIYTMTYICRFPVPTYVQRYMLVNRRSDTYIRYCVLFETTDLRFKGKHLKVVDESEYFTCAGPASSARFYRNEWTKVSDINISSHPEEHEEFLAMPSTLIASQEFPIGYNQLEDSILQKGTTLDSMIPLYISIAHDLLIYDTYKTGRSRIPYAFLSCKRQSSQSQSQRIFIKPVDIETPIHTILRTRPD